MFLRKEDTPTESGMEKALTIVWIGHGAFRSAGSGEWVNEVGFTLNEAREMTLARLAWIVAVVVAIQACSLGSEQNVDRVSSVEFNLAFSLEG